MAVIEVKNLTKRFDSLTALDGVNLEVGQGEYTDSSGPARRQNNDNQDFARPFAAHRHRRDF